MFLFCLLTAARYGDDKVIPHNDNYDDTGTFSSLPPPPKKWIEKSTKNVHVKSCPSCGVDIMRASKSCTYCGWMYVSKSETNYNPYEKRPRTKAQHKIYIDAGSPLGPHTKITNVSTIKTLQKRLDEHPNQGLVIVNHNLFCAHCKKNIITSKQNVNNHINTKRHITNLFSSK